MSAALADRELTAGDCLTAGAQFLLFCAGIHLAARQAGDLEGATELGGLTLAAAALGLVAGAWRADGQDHARPLPRALLAVACGVAPAAAAMATWLPALLVAVAGLVAGREVGTLRRAWREHRSRGAPLIFPDGVPVVPALLVAASPLAAVVAGDAVGAVRAGLFVGALAGVWAARRPGGTRGARPWVVLLLPLGVAVLTLRGAPVGVALAAAPLFLLFGASLAAAPAAAALGLAAALCALGSAAGAPPARHYRVVQQGGASDAPLFLLRHESTGSYQVRRGGLELYTTLYDARMSEALVHPAMARAPRRERVLLVGGECMGAARELAKYGELKELDVVELFPEARPFCRRIPALRRMLAPGVSVPLRTFRIDDEPFVRLLAEGRKYDVVLVVGPHPPTQPRGLHSGAFYTELYALLAKDGVLGTRLGGFDASGPLYCNAARVHERFDHFLPFHVYAGAPLGPEQHLFAIASERPLADAPMRVVTRSIDDRLFRVLTHFPPIVRWPRVAEPKEGCLSLLSQSSR